MFLINQKLQQLFPEIGQMHLDNLLIIASTLNMSPLKDVCYSEIFARLIQAEPSLLQNEVCL